jgi:hypothetical protein
MMLMNQRVLQWGSDYCLKAIRANFMAIFRRVITVSILEVLLFSSGSRRKINHYKPASFGIGLVYRLVTLLSTTRAKQDLLSTGIRFTVYDMYFCFCHETSKKYNSLFENY